MLKVIFYIKAEKYLNGENPIFSKISYNNKSITLSTGKSISKESFFQLEFVYNEDKLINFKDSLV